MSVVPMPKLASPKTARVLLPVLYFVKGGGQSDDETGTLHIRVLISITADQSSN